MPATTAGTASDNQYKELGAFWQKTSKGGEKYLTGNINLKSIGGEDRNIDVVVFKNKNKKKEIHPDLRVYLSEKTNGAAGTRGAKTTDTAPAPKPAAPTTSESIL